VATKYGIISKGHIIKEITAAQLQTELAKTTDILVDQPERLCEVLPEVSAYIPGGVRLVGEVDLNGVLGAIIQKGIRITSINCHESSFEDYYLKMIGGKQL
jgi:ABC-2 type transport system ATP-binding protein